MAGPGSSVVMARLAYRSPSGYRRPPIESAPTAGDPGSAACAGSRFIALADLWNDGPNKNANWHCACVIAWEFWNAPSGEAPLLRRLQARRCRQTGGRLWKAAEVDHRIPLFRVWNEYRDTPWPKLLDFWGLPNLQIINRDAHALKSALEARDRRGTLNRN
jgi:hypothetical protein